MAATKIILIILGCVAIMYGGICLWIYRAQERLLFVPRPMARDFPYRFSQPFEEHLLPVDDHQIALVHFRQPQAKGVVLHFHGNGTIVADVDAVAQSFLRRGYDAIFFDYRGYGKSDGQLTSEADLHRDAEVAYAYALQHYNRDEIVFYGHSLGSGIATQLARTAQPRMLILESPYFSMRDVASTHMPWVPMILLKYHIRTDQWIGAVQAPIMLIHGTDDRLIPFDSSERLLTLAQSPSELVAIVGGDHNDLPRFAEYHAALDRALGPAE